MPFIGHLNDKYILMYALHRIFERAISKHFSHVLYSCVCVCVCVYVCVCVDVYICIYTNIYTCTCDIYFDVCHYILWHMFWCMPLVVWGVWWHIFWCMPLYSVTYVLMYATRCMRCFVTYILMHATRVAYIRIYATSKPLVVWAVFSFSHHKILFWWLIHQWSFMNESWMNHVFHTHMNAGRDWIIHSATSSIHVCVSERHDSFVSFHSAAQNSSNESAQ